MIHDTAKTKWREIIWLSTMSSSCLTLIMIRIMFMFYMKLNWTQILVFWLNNVWWCLKLFLDLPFDLPATWCDDIINTHSISFHSTGDFVNNCRSSCFNSLSNVHFPDVVEWFEITELLIWLAIITKCNGRKF